MCPAPGDDAAVETLLRRFFVGVVRQRHVALAKVDDFLLINTDSAELVHVAENVVFKVAVVRRRGEDDLLMFAILLL